MGAAAWELQVRAGSGIAHISTIVPAAGQPAVMLHSCVLPSFMNDTCLFSVAMMTLSWWCRTEQEERLGLRPRFEILKQRADEYFPLKKLEKPHLRWAAGYPEGPVIAGQSDREAYPGYKRYQERIHADVDSMRFWGSVVMIERHSTSQFLMF